MSEDPGQQRRRTFYLYSDAQLARTPTNPDGRYGPSAVGIVILDYEGRTIHEAGFYVGNQTNNRSELLGINVGLTVAMAVLPSPTRAIVVANTDSRIAFQGVAQDGLVEPRLRAMSAAIRELQKGFDQVDYQYVPRDTRPIRRAETLARKTLEIALGRKLTRRGSKGRKHKTRFILPPDPYGGQFFAKKTEA
jgi:ribonuclease HI